jgi:serine phosphatase RsbU (regulator of sigma subunit)
MAKEQYQAASAALDTAEYYCLKDLGLGLVLTYVSVVQTQSELALAQKDYHAALRYAQKAYDMSVEDGVVNNQLISMKEKVNALNHLGRYREALETLIEHDEIRDSIYEKSSAEQLNELNKKYEVNELKMQAERDKMQAERDKMQAERDKMQAERRQMYLLIAIVAVVLIAIIIIVLARLQAARRLAKIRAAQERLESELQIARDIQMSMVPSVFPEREGLDMYASMTPAKEVGGDLYGYLLMGDKLYFAVGDVSGKGVPASLFMAQATRLFLTLAKQGMMPAEICTRMNDALSGDDNENGMFVTFFLGLVDLTTGHLSFCNAGHNPPVIGGGEHQGEFLDMIPNAPIGLWPELEYEGEQIDTIKGRPLFIYTDGLNEAENRQQQQFGDERLLDILRDTHFDSARQVIDKLTAEVETHRNGAEPNDDLTMMCLRVN